MTGPISDTKAGSQPKITRQRETSSAASFGRLDVLDDPAVGAGLVALAPVVDHALERALGRAHALDRLDLLAQGQDRLDLQRRAEVGLRAADPAAAAQVLQRVDGEPHLQRVAGLLGAVQDGLGIAARARGHRRGQDDQPLAAAAALRVEHGHALGAVAELLARLARGLDGARDAAGEVDRDDVAARVEQRLPDGEELADRRLTRRGQCAHVTQALVVGVEIDDVALEQVLAVAVHVQGDLLDSVARDEVGGKVVTGVGHHRGGRHGGQPTGVSTPNLWQTQGDRPTTEESNPDP